MATITTHTTQTSIRSWGTLSTGSTLYDVLDLRTAIKAFLFVWFARTSSTSNGGGNPAQVIVRPTLGDVAERIPADQFGRVATTTAAANQTTTTTSCTAGSTTNFNVSSTTGITADTLIGLDVGTSSFEIVRVSKVSGSTVYIDAPVTRTHASGVTVTTLAEAWTIELPGGAKYEIISDFGAGGGSLAYDVKVQAQVHDYDTIT